MASFEDLKSKDWRLKNLYSIVDKNGIVVPFVRNRAQEHYNLNKHNKNINLKSRQLGFTTEECISATDDTLWNKNFYSLFISEDDTLARDTFDKKIKFAYDNYDTRTNIGLKSLFKTDLNSANQLKIDFGDGNNSSIIVRSSGRGGTFHRIHISEFARICKKYPLKAREIIEGVFPSLVPGGYICIESTAEEDKGYFHDMFWDAWDRKEKDLTPNDWKAHFYNWIWDDFGMEKIKPYIIPVEMMENREFFEEVMAKNKFNLLQINYYYNAWKDVAKKISVLKKQYPITPEEAFEGSGNKLFNQEVLAGINTKQPVEVIGNWKIYDKYREGHNYIAGADVAEGVGQDSSTCQVIDLTPRVPRQVAVYKSNEIAPDLFGYELKNGLSRFGYPLLGVERNNHGHATLAILKLVYPLEQIFIANHNRLKSKSQTEPSKFGFHTNGATKPAMMFDLAKGLEDDILEIVDAGTKTELRSYDKEELAKVNFDPEETQHYDLVMALAICWQMRKYVDLEIGRETIQKEENEWTDMLEENLNNNDELFNGV